MAKLFTIGLGALLLAWLVQACEKQPAASSASEAPVKVAAPRAETPNHPPSAPASWSPPTCAVSPFKVCNQSDLREADFRQADLSGHVVFFNANAQNSTFSEANLSNSALHFTHFQGADLEYTNLMGADLPGANLAGARLERSQLRNINCIGCDFTFAQLQDSDLHGANFRGSNLSYADLRGADFTQADITQVLWHRTICPDGSQSEDNGDTCGGHLTNRSLACNAQPALHCPDQDLSRVDWRAANLNQAHLEAADLRQALLIGATLKRTNLAHANLRGADLSHADLFGANLLRANLEQTSWKQTRCPDGTSSEHNGGTCGGHLEPGTLPCRIAPGADCEGADLAGRDLSFANLQGANLQGADLRGARLIGANLQNTKLQNANLQAADLTGSHITGILTEGADLTDITTINATCSKEFSPISKINCSQQR